MADICRDRVEKREAPRFPHHTEASHTLTFDGACRVKVAFTLSPAGVPELKSSVAEQTRCHVFERSAGEAVASSTFSKGEGTRDCKWSFVFKLEEPQQEENDTRQGVAADP